ncbi:MAG TPA: DUF2268 domain-containing putative Zn-dependent protease [Candidatus Saccharimonadales bacterium]|nr:DUF2268 domain-containing putative Zn-dependent protease [Candidatus Saccharimonadales bacterium]
MKILLADSPFWKELGEDFQKKYKRAAESAYEEVTKLLPFGSGYVTFVVQPREYGLIAETHDIGRTHNSDLIELAFDPKFARKNPQQILDQVRPTVFHEMNHAARFNLNIWHTSFLDHCVLEGLAAVFARDYADYDALWGRYDEGEARKWLAEIRKKEKTLDYDAYMFKHPDGRRWIGYKVGTYLIDQAVKNSGKSVVELSKLESADILTLAEPRA